MAFIRLPLAVLGSGIAILAYQLAGNPVGLAAGLGWSTLTLTVVNLLCLALLVWRSRVEGLDLKAAIRFQWRLLFRDILGRLTWSLLLGGMLLIGILAVVFAVTFASALAYVVGFFWWGLYARIIVNRQGRSSFSTCESWRPKYPPARPALLVSDPAHCGVS